MKISISNFFNYLSIISVAIFFYSCKSTADKTFEFNFSTDFAIGEYEIYEGINTLGNIGMQDALISKLKEEGTSIDKIHDVTISSASLSIIDTSLTFSDLNNFTVDILGESKKATMKTIANASDVDLSATKAELIFTKDDLSDYFKENKLYIIPSAEAKRDIPGAFGMKIEVTFTVGVKN